MDEPTLSTEELFLVMCCTIDELHQEAAPDCVQSRPGSDRLEMSDAEVITLSTSAGRPFQRFRAELPPNGGKRLSALVSRSHQPLALPPQAERLDGHSARNFAPIGGSTADLGCLDYRRFDADYHSRVSAVEISTDVDVGG
ncbi:hypothetical protein GGP53_002837 [Salinibacter ruber]|uniref:hypothetical protein n=1 Tax=Salinibacter ruber TaxID=146919 RepID=UPI002167FD0B|nr:hypothetical protein [Salinibacter ruber]MCS3628990.1 hypothetical protein [Salinibacter ruber]MCS4145867.1 hypothetical protein [Salinibacter ruber]